MLVSLTYLIIDFLFFMFLRATRFFCRVRFRRGRSSQRNSEAMLRSAPDFMKRTLPGDAKSSCSRRREKVHFAGAFCFLNHGALINSNSFWKERKRWKHRWVVRGVLEGKKVSRSAWEGRFGRFIRWKIYSYSRSGASTPPALVH